jgi:hypothetical protein
VRTCKHFVKCDAVELWRRHTPDEADALESGQRAVIDVDALRVPPHNLFELLFESVVNSSGPPRQVDAPN